MNDSKTQPTCESVQLDVLLFGDEDSAEFRDSAEHVEDCVRCQARLEKMAADEGSWIEARNVLRNDELDATDEQHVGAHRSGLHELLIDGFRSPSVSRHLKLDFLSPPSHPEMLGRLGRYEIERVIGAGGMGIVLKGFDTELNRPAAIKVLAPHLAHSGAARQRFAREARAAAAVVHEHIVAIHNVESEHELPFLVMQYVPGRSLQDRVDQEGPLSPAEILRIGMQAASGLAAAHAQGVIHRDVKPANILLENGVERVLLTDFGLARAADDASLTHSGIVAGTPHYMSPEQAQGKPVDNRSDLFSLGSVLYFMATGHPPFRAERAMAVLHRICHDRHRPVWEIEPRIPDDLADVIDRLLDKKPGRRYAHAAEVAQALACVLSRLQQSRPRRARRWLRRVRSQRGQLLAVAGALLATITLAWFFGWFRPAGAIANKSSETTSESNSASESESSASLDLFVEVARLQEVEIANEVVSIDRSLNQIARAPFPESVILRAVGDSWRRELQVVDSQITRFEKSWSIAPANSSSFDSPKGDKP